MHTNLLPLHPPNKVQVNKVAFSNSISNTDDNHITSNMLNIGSDLTSAQENELLTLLPEFRDSFALDLNELGTTNITEMHI